MRILVLGPETEELVRRVRDYAEKPENWFRPGPVREWDKLEGSDDRPGCKPEHKVVLTDGFCCIFSWTEAEFTDGTPVVVRDLAVSVPGAIPNPIAVFEIAELFGFTKRPDKSLPHPEWHIDVDKCNPPCVTVVERAPV